MSWQMPNLELSQNCCYVLLKNDNEHNNYYVMLCYLLCYDDNYSEVMVLIYHVNYSDGSPIQEHRRIVVRHEIPGNNTINIIFSRLVNIMKERQLHTEKNHCKANVDFLLYIREALNCEKKDFL